LNCPARSRETRTGLTGRARESCEKESETRVPVLWVWGARRDAWERARALAEAREEDDAIVMTESSEEPFFCRQLVILDSDGNI
jgi:hypothetical protein